MKKKLVAGIIIAVAIVAGLIAVFYHYNAGNNNLGVNTTQSVSPAPSVPSIPSHTPKSYTENLSESFGAANP